jgi:hypothetical protein
VNFIDRVPPVIGSYDFGDTPQAQARQSIQRYRALHAKLDTNSDSAATSAELRSALVAFRGYADRKRIASCATAMMLSQRHAGYARETIRRMPAAWSGCWIQMSGCSSVASKGTGGWHRCCRAINGPTSPCSRCGVFGRNRLPRCPLGPWPGKRGPLSRGGQEYSRAFTDSEVGWPAPKP